MAERPKRRKYKDNPYTLDCIEKRKFYSISFKDGRGKKHKVKVSKEVFEAFDRFELDDLSEMNEYDNHIEHSEIYENNLNKRALDKPKSIDEIVETNIINEELRKAINSLSRKQKRRIQMYYFGGLTQQEIADIEGTSLRAVQYTLNDALQELKKILENFKN